MEPLPHLQSPQVDMGAAFLDWRDSPDTSALAQQAQAMYRAQGFAAVPDVLQPAAWQSLAEDLWPTLRQVSEAVTLLQEEQDPTELSDGASFRRVDPYCLRNPGTRQMLEQLLDRLGLTAMATHVARQVTPLVREIAGPVSYRRFYFYLYEEDDYISTHNDHQVGNRVDVQFPVSLATCGGLRVLSNGLLRMHYDVPGAMNVLGPRVWHEVPPLLRGPEQTAAPRRFNMGFRFLPEVE